MRTEKQQERTIIFYKNYFRDFFRERKEAVRSKIILALKVVESTPRLPESVFKHMEGTKGLYEIRLRTGSDIFRIFCFFDKGNLVVLANGFQKKDQKTPRREIKKALKIKSEYESERS
ncbi:type II toxin-antitoxin system RelE/ParE family toxin [Dyadobacter luticola]|uniref:Type II toxin-antitoxin system RelE/ParE family toxin n=1 Tax=Dyadobacter luticola TaxID=1979387 RepID=A0A5R9L139_9BACT|nr:type II toxin-antitoxin system RelE/ParE family toxin [Dyadobacter luticola]TLV02262.1 type II toxin-antitoxin system RelE/ParE family toxin [Dyadobacter luticola]